MKRSVPGLCRNFFLSLDGVVFAAPLLESCGRYPLILFGHGMCELDTEHYKKWFEIPAALARSAYVALVPALSGAPPSEADDEGIDPHPLPSTNGQTWTPTG